MSEAARQDNADQIEYWNGAGGEKWLRSEDQRERGLGPLGVAALQAAAPRAGEHAIDIGCGAGPTTVALAQAVGAGGSVLGVDVSRGLVAAAQQRAAAFANVRFIVADAASHAFQPGSADLLFSRFGVMFFADPPAAFANMRRALKPGGRLVFMCWRSFKENGWAFVPFMAAVPHLPPIERPPPEAPGPFAFADGARVERIVRGGGFVDVAAKAYDSMMQLSATGLEDALRLVSEAGPMSRAIADVPETMRKAALANVAQVLARHMQGDVIALPAACWIVSARNPG